MSHYECHITIERKPSAFEQRFASRWEIQNFQNYNLDWDGKLFELKPVRSEMLMTCKAEDWEDTPFHNVFSHYTRYLTTMFGPRFKLESDISNPNQIYCEAHYKFKRNPLKFLSGKYMDHRPLEKHIHFSQNTDKNTWWGTIRADRNNCHGSMADSLSHMHKSMMEEYSKEIARFEIESVVVDTARELDAEWENFWKPELGGKW